MNATSNDRTKNNIGEIEINRNDIVTYNPTRKENDITNITKDINGETDDIGGEFTVVDITNNSKDINGETDDIAGEFTVVEFGTNTGINTGAPIVDGDDNKN
jgi:hypothetical protein